MDKPDRCDFEILRLLQKNARLTNSEIASKVGKSPSIVSRRIAELEACKYILGYQAILNRHMLGLGVLVTTLVELVAHRPENIDSFEMAIGKHFPNVMQWMRLQGSWDYLLNFVVRDMEHYSELHRKLTMLPEVHRTRGHTPQHVSLVQPLPLP